MARIFALISKNITKVRLDIARNRGLWSLRLFTSIILAAGFAYYISREVQQYLNQPVLLQEIAPERKDAAPVLGILFCSNDTTNTLAAEARDSAGTFLVHVNFTPINLGPRLQNCIVLNTTSDTVPKRQRAPDNSFSFGWPMDVRFQLSTSSSSPTPTAPTPTTTTGFVGFFTPGTSPDPTLVQFYQVRSTVSIGFLFYTVSRRTSLAGDTTTHFDWTFVHMPVLAPPPQGAPWRLNIVPESFEVRQLQEQVVVSVFSVCANAAAFLGKVVNMEKLLPVFLKIKEPVPDSYENVAVLEKT
ncbi:hypothetical protein HK102_014201 [Quaeritorhiza haematococci]|nr:hypothetical protein HK102_014201 [Quaeritorhiza haematococci]